MTIEGCPEGMYPLDLDYEPEVCDTFESLREGAERASNILNLPLSWYFSGHENDEDADEDEKPSFTLVFVMPRKSNRTWGVRTYNFDHAEVQAWLDTWVRGEINTWFGWTED